MVIKDFSSKSFSVKNLWCTTIRDADNDWLLTEVAAIINFQ